MPLHCQGTHGNQTYDSRPMIATFRSSFGTVRLLDVSVFTVGCAHAKPSRDIPHIRAAGAVPARHRLADPGSVRKRRGRSAASIGCRSRSTLL
jgi:hypothetical protein